jgi:hypothetical protein
MLLGTISPYVNPPVTLLSSLFRSPTVMRASARPGAPCPIATALGAVFGLVVVAVISRPHWRSAVVGLAGTRPPVTPAIPWLTKVQKVRGAFERLTPACAIVPLWRRRG